MSHVQPWALDLDKAVAIAEAQFTVQRAFPGATRDEGTVSGHCQKAVLWTIWAHEGAHITYDAIAELSGCSRVAAARAVCAMEIAGIVRRQCAVLSQPSAYTIVLSRLRDLRGEVQLCTPAAAKRGSGPRYPRRKPSSTPEAVA